MNDHTRRTTLVAALVRSALAVGRADDKSPAGPKNKPPEPITRLFVQDLKTCSLKWADVRPGEGGQLALDPLAAVDGLTKFDPGKQKLIQMRDAGSLACVGTRDDEDGASESGCELVQSGVGYSNHDN